jgi:hypothetical protein
MKSLELSKGGFLIEYVDEDGQVAWIAEHADIESDYVRQVLALEFEYMVGAGIITGVDDFTFGVYEPAELRGASKVVDTDRLARDAEERLAIPKEVADKVFEHELAFLKMGLSFFSHPNRRESVVKAPCRGKSETRFRASLST